MFKKTIGIIGSRTRDTEEDYQKTLEAFRQIAGHADTIVSGGCPKGGDKFAERIAEELGFEIKIYPAQWGKYGRSAGFKRNTDIANDANVLIACVSEHRTGGTEDTIEKFLKTKSKWNLRLV